MTVLTLIIFLTSLWSVTYYAQHSLRDDMQHLLSDQQQSTAAFVAKNVNDEMSDRIRALEILATKITAPMMKDPARLQAMLEDRKADFSLFNNGIAVAGVDGTVIAEYPPLPGRLGANFAERDYMVGPLKQGKMTIGRPVMSKLMHAPAFVIGMPILDPQGTVIGVLGGVTDLRLPNFLDNITQGHWGRTGVLLLASRLHRVVITASDKQRIMESFPLRGVAPIIDARADGKENTTVFVDPRGVEVLSAAMSVPVANWFVAVSMPTEEAFAPIRDLERRLALAAAFATLLTGVLTWWVLKRQLAPMTTAAKLLTVLPGPDQQAQPLPISRQDEVGQLIAGFNHLVSELGQRDAFLKLVLNNSSAAIFLIDSNGRITQANQRMAEIFKYPVETLTGLEYLKLVPPSQRELRGQQMAARVAGNVRSLDLDLLFSRADGSEFWGHVTSRRFYDVKGEEHGLIGTIQDITERKSHEESLQNFRIAMDTSADAIYLVDRTSMRFVDVNEAACRMQGRTREELMALGPDGALSLTQAELARTYDSIIAGGSGTEPLEILRHREDGTHVWVELRRRARRSDAGWMIVTTVRDITQRKRTEEALRQSEAHLHSILESTSDGILAIDQNGKVIRFNQRFGQLWQVPQALLDSKDDQALLDHVVSQLTEPEEFVSRVQALYGSELVTTDTISFKDGRIFERFTSPLMLDTFVTGRIWSFRDITEHKQMEEQVRQLAFYDTLTLLPNRRLLGDRLSQALAASRRSGRYGVLLFLDLDNFKTLNDTHGHAAGDLLLEQAANRMKICVREIDTVARLGGDEFVVVVDDLNADKAEATAQAGPIAEKIRAALAVPYSITVKQKDHPDAIVEHQCTASIGVVVFIDGEGSQDDFLRWADTAMYRAKDAGSNLIRFYEAAGQL